MRVAYLCSRYPAVSHTFVQREIIALRARGVEVETFTVRAPEREELLSALDAAEDERTVAILPTSAVRLARAHLAALLRSPVSYVATLALALRLSPGGARGALWQLFYFAEAMIFWSECRRRDLGHVHVHFANVAADVALLATTHGRRAGGPRSWSFTLHGPTELADVEGHRLAEKAHDAAFVACVSDFARSQLMALLEPDEWDKLAVVRCGLDPSAAGEVEAPGAPDEGPVDVLCVGRLSRRKGHAVLLDAIAMLAGEGFDVTCTLAGDGPERGPLERQAGELGIAGRVRFLGAVPQDRVRELNAETDIGCLPSFAEGVPVVLMEAMSAGVPVVATRVMGVPELVEDGHSGLLVPPGRPDLLGEALRRLIIDPGARARMGELGRERVTSGFDLHRSAELLEALFEDVPG